MDELPTVETAMEVDDLPVETCNELAEDNDVVMSCDKDVPNEEHADEAEIDNDVVISCDKDVPNEEHTDETETVTVCPDIISDGAAVPYNEQNGDVVEIDNDDSNQKEFNKESEESGCVEVDNSKQPDESQNSDDRIVPFFNNFETDISKDNCLIDYAQINSDMVDAVDNKSKRKYSHTAQVPSDYTPEELEVYNKMFGHGKQAIQFLRLHCTACGTHLGSAPNNQFRRYIHPLLRVLICKVCFTFYGSGEFDKDEDGSELYCRWCGQGGKVLCCASCPYVFCQRCIKTNLGKAKLQEVLDSDDWNCFDCVPSQTIELRVIVRALYDYVQSEINLAAELNQPERLKVDNSMCCAHKQNTSKIKIKLPTPKRKNSISSNGDLAIDDVYPKKKKIKIKTLSSLLSGDKKVVNQGQTFINPVAVSARGWDTQIDTQVEDEVVCTPDLSLLMPMADEEEDTVEPPQEPPQPEEPLPPPLIPINSTSKSKKESKLKFVEAPQSPNAYTMKQLGYSIPGKLVLNTMSANARPLLSKTLADVPKSNFTPVRLPGVQQPLKFVTQTRLVPSKIVPGTKYNWFEKAAQFTTRVNSILTSRLGSLTKEQSTVNSLEGLATIHNNFQEILNNSIKSLTQIRKNLRNDFISGLKTLKYDTFEKQTPTPTKNTNDDNDVIIVDAPSSIPKPAVQSSPVTFGRLKLKPASSLLMENAVITIPDDVLDEPILPKQVETEKPHKNVNQEEMKETSDIPEAVSSEPIEEDLNPETRALINRALLESKFELLVAENMKVNVPSEISKDMLKAIVSVRVVLEDRFGPATPRMRPRPGYKAMTISKEDEDDIEKLLSSSIVLNISKHTVFNNEYDDKQNKPILNISDEVERLSNGVL